ncbi:Vacuolar protein sorting-associated protein 41-like protein [Psilocybe cubensis]|uniref:Vacuolar protein sorting-associated protein 41 n=2 Tax=Psilocybe cubensis TaxID=181762 RepID=A0A8H8CJG2_PSICU|nr:Vacuolar protein sorting-associated protein 41-like protein [Psilocybe cubensis]KAH9482153.1 Vacuolar protein sorting-associated protein 41-like protein [Psilocybe cubensis]
MSSTETSTGESPVKREATGTPYDEKADNHVPSRLSDSPTPMSDYDEQELRKEHEGKNGKDAESDESEEEEDDEAESEEEEDEDEDDEDEEDDEEPALKYERITGEIPDLLKKDSASALCVSNKLLAMGTHAGIIHILDITGKRIKSYKPHLASVVDISMDATADFVATASIDGQVVVRSLSTPERYSFDMKRPMRTVAMEPDFAKKGTRAFVCGGLSGSLVLREKGWLGHKETLLHSGEGPIWQVKWKGRLIAWANDNGVKIYDNVSQTRIAFIDRQADSPRADLFKCTLHWQDNSTLLIAWANFIKVARIRERPRTNTAQNIANAPPLIVEVTAVFQLDCMVSGIVPHPTPVPASMIIDGLPTSLKPDGSIQTHPQTLTSFLIVAYTPPETFDDTDEITDDRRRQARKAAERPEMRIISRAGEELATDALSVADYHLWGCNDYTVVEVASSDDPLIRDADRSYVVMSPRDLVHVMPRDKRDHVEWLVERRQYEEALSAVETIEAEEAVTGFKAPESQGKAHLTSQDIGQRFIEHLVQEGDFVKAARLCPKVCAQDAKRWEDWIFTFAHRKQLHAIIPYVPKENPRLDHVIYEMMLADFLKHDRKALLQTIKDWPRGLYDISAVIVAVRAELDRTASTSSTISSSGDSTILMECLAELYTANRQPGKALPFYLRLRKSNVFDLIRDNNLFTDVQDQVLLLVEFDHELIQKRKESLGKGEQPDVNVQSDAITLLVDNLHSIPISRVVQQLKQRPYYLFLYLDALVHKDAQLVTDFADLQVKMYAEFATSRLIDFLRASSSYNLEMAYKECQERDLVPEMVFLLGRMGNNKKALNLIIERLGDVHRAIDFAKEQSDDDLWEDLLKYSETRPAFIRGLLENVGVEISPIRLIRRIKNGLEIPGLKEALIKILQDFHLQISLLEGCQTILDGDSSDLSRKLQRNQSSGFFLSSTSKCTLCLRPLQDSPPSLMFLFLCRHVVHSTCVSGAEDLPLPTPDPYFSSTSDIDGGMSRGISGAIAFETMIRSRLRRGCPVCHKNGEGH